MRFSPDPQIWIGIDLNAPLLLVLVAGAVIAVVLAVVFRRGRRGR